MRLNNDRKRIIMEKDRCALGFVTDRRTGMVCSRDRGVNAIVDRDRRQRVKNAFF